MSTYRAIPEAPTGALLNPRRGPFSVVIPLARTNIVTNPSCETNTTGYTAVGGSIARATTASYHGAYSLAITPTAATSDGAYYGTVSLTAGVTYAFSAKVYDPTPGRKYKFSVATTGGTVLTTVEFVSTGRWQWVYGFWTETSTTTRRIYLTKNGGAQTSVFYWDGLQVESCADGVLVATTYIDGDQAGLLPNQFPSAYGWNGTPHASTSYRSGATRAGGYLVNLDRYRFWLTALAGLGLASVANTATPGGTVDGATYQATVVGARSFALHGAFDADDAVSLDIFRSQLYEAMGPDAVSPRQPLVLHYQQHDGDTPVGAVGRIVAGYESGLEQVYASAHQEQATITFTQYMPAIQGCDDGIGMTPKEDISVTQASTLFFRDATGDWSLITDENSSILDVIRAADGAYYLTGSFTSIAGVSANRIARYDPTTATFTALGTGLNAEGRKLVFDPAGNLYVGGEFTTAGGTTVNRVAMWNGSAWSALGATGVSDEVHDMAWGAEGLYVVGGFLTAGGVTVNHVALWTGSAWQALGTTGVNVAASAVAIATDGTVYVGGDFTTAGGSSAVRAAQWNPATSAWSALGAGLNGITWAITAGPDGRVYYGGEFTTAGGITAAHLAQWNGSGWSALAGGITTGSNEYVTELKFGADTLLYVGGRFTNVNSVAVADSFVMWNGTSFISPDIEVPGVTHVNAIAIAPNGELMLALLSDTGSGTAQASAATTLTNAGTATTYPILSITGPASGSTRIHQLRNYTTGRIVSFNLSVYAGETITMAFSPAGLFIHSTFRGVITGAVIPGSSTIFPLIRGDNRVAFFAAGSTITVTARWQNLYQSIADLVR